MIVKNNEPRKDEGSSTSIMKRDSAKELDFLLAEENRKDIREQEKRNGSHGQKSLNESLIIWMSRMRYREDAVELFPNRHGQSAKLILKQLEKKKRACLLEKSKLLCSVS